MRKVLVNIICGFIPWRGRRNRIRMELNNPIRKWTRFAKTFSDKKHPVVRYTYGHRCANFVVNIDNRYVFKFPVNSNGYEKSVREKRITDALRPISPIKIPEMEILDFDGVYVRKYEYIGGVGYHDLPYDVQKKNIDTIAKQLANFLYIIGKSDPKSLHDLKPNPKEKPAMMYGWNHDDLWDNFIMDPINFKIIGFIDWEGAKFGDFRSCFTHGIGNVDMCWAVLVEYIRLFMKNKK